MSRHNNVVICATCGRDFDPGLSTAMPFCSARCRAVDLSQWLDELHGVPWDRPSADELTDDESQDWESDARSTDESE